MVGNERLTAAHVAPGEETQKILTGVLLNPIFCLKKNLSLMPRLQLLPKNEGLG